MPPIGRKYAVYEQFMSFQGEGVHAGRPAYFIRLHGCDQKCHFCDSAGTWHPDWKPGDIPRRNAAWIATTLPKWHRFAFTVVTGGEPALYDLGPLVDAIREATNRPVHLETAGHKPITAYPNWITLSPKPFATPPLNDNVFRANEFKLIIEDERSLEDALRVIEGRSSVAPVWLHPEWSQRNNQQVLDLITNFVVNQGEPFRAGWQLHKLFRADLLDPTSNKQLIPLGGEPSRGY